MKKLKDLAAAKQEEGATLVEILVGITIMAIILASSGLAIMSCLRIMMNNEAEDQAYQLARARLEIYRSMDYGSVAIYSGDADRVRNESDAYKVLSNSETGIKAKVTGTASGLASGLEPKPESEPESETEPETEYTIVTDIVWVGSNMSRLRQDQVYVNNKCVGGKLVKASVTWGEGADAKTVTSQSVLSPSFKSCI